MGGLTFLRPLDRQRDGLPTRRLCGTNDNMDDDLDLVHVADWCFCGVHLRESCDECCTDHRGSNLYGHLERYVACWPKRARETLLADTFDVSLISEAVRGRPTRAARCRCGDGRFLSREDGDPVEQFAQEGSQVPVSRARDRRLSPRLLRLRAVPLAGCRRVGEAFGVEWSSSSSTLQVN